VSVQFPAQERPRYGNIPALSFITQRQDVTPAKVSA